MIFVEYPEEPGVLVVYRKVSERNANPERLNLDRKELNQVPILKHEERLKMLNLQHNHIKKIEKLAPLPNLIFLDFSYNEIKVIPPLNTVSTLKVLILGENSIEQIKNLQYLSRLDQLDLHSNKIAKIENLSTLVELRVLNLSNNKITAIDNLNGLVSLTELNLKKNEIGSIKGLINCPKLQRLFLSHNRIQSFENINDLKNAKQLIELTLDENPINNPPIPYYKYCLNACSKLRHIDLKEVTVEFKASLEEKKLENNTNKTIDSKSVSKESINAKLNSQLKIERKVNLSEEESKGINHSLNPLIKTIENEWRNEVIRLSNKYKCGMIQRKKESKSESYSQCGHVYIVDEKILHIYGNALEVLDKSELYNIVEEIHFKYIFIDKVLEHSNLPKLFKFTKLTRLSFSYNYFNLFLQISKLECLQHLNELNIFHNDISHTTLFRNFVIHQFNKLNRLNNEPVTELDREIAKALFRSYDKLRNDSILYKVLL